MKTPHAMLKATTMLRPIVPVEAKWSERTAQAHDQLTSMNVLSMCNFYPNTEVRPLPMSRNMFTATCRHFAFSSHKTSQSVAPSGAQHACHREDLRLKCLGAHRAQESGI